MEKKWFIGIDISKKTLDVVIYDSMKKKSDSENYLKISNDADGFEELLAWFKKKRIKLKDIVVGMENTGAYGYDLRLFLEQTKVDYSVYMPFTLKQALGLVRGKNDKLDAERIAYYTWLHREELTYSRLSGSAVIRLQELIAERKSYIKQLAVHKAFITEKEGKPGTLSLTRALQSREFLENQIKAIEEEMEEVIRTEDSLSRNYHLLLSIKGIGKVNAIQTLVHTNNFKGFETARQYANYLGIAPHGSTSGTSVRVNPHISHIGPKLLRAELSQAANSAIVHDKEMKIYFLRKRKEGKPYGVVLNAVRFKLVCRMFAVIKRGTPYVDLLNYRN